MSQQATKGQESTPVIGLAGKRKWGYSVEQVDEFLARAHDQYEQDDPSLTQAAIQIQSFDLERNGYIIGQVDAALVRLEKAVVDKQTLWDITHNGQQAWNDETTRLAATLRECAEREPKVRFADAERGEIGYNKKQVDKLVDQAWDLIARTLSLPLSSTEKIDSTVDLSAAAISNVIFTQHKGKKGYAESSVDAYLNRVIQVLTRFESVDRIQGGVDTPAHAAIEETPVSAPADDAETAMPVSFPPAFAEQTADSNTEQTESAAESTQQFSPFDFSEQAEETTDAPSQQSDSDGRTEEAPASSSLAHLVKSGDEQTETDEESAQTDPEPGMSNVAPTNEPESEPQAQPMPAPAPAPAHNEQVTPDDDSSNDSEAEPTPEEKPSASAEDYITSVLSGSSVQTSSFEIPNLTFGEATRDENAKSDAAETDDSDTRDDLPSTGRSE